MAHYMAFIWDDEAAWSKASTDDIERVMRAHREFGVRHAARLQGGNRLHSSDTATSLRRDDDGGLLVSDGVFAETKEHIGGYYLFEADDMDQALAIAAEVPCPYGWVELRPILLTS